MILFIASLIDWILGDPVNFPHPIRFMGYLISSEEKLARKVCKSDLDLRIAGFIIVVFNVSLVYFGLSYIFSLLDFNKYLKIIFMSHIAYTMVAAKSLSKEARAVKKEAKISLQRGRSRLRYIVGRNTDKLTIPGIIRATVETVAENTSDGVIAPLFYMTFNVPLAVTYKMVNTMDSMLGYNNAKYKDLGYFPAKIDDIFNFIPARLTGFLMVLSSQFSFNVKRGLAIMLRDHKKHKSPNSAWPEAAVAGLLGIQLGGGAFYENIFVEKPFIGDSTREVRYKDIDDTIRIMYRSQVLFLIIYLVFLLVTKGGLL